MQQQRDDAEPEVGKITRSTIINGKEERSKHGCCQALGLDLSCFRGKIAVIPDGWEQKAQVQDLG